MLAVLVLLNAGWMVFDGTHALVAGDYVTPSTGSHAGQLGPWSKVVETAGINPRSTLMKSVFVVYGLAFLAAGGAWLARVTGAWKALMALAILGLWHLPFGTLINVLVVVLLVYGRRSST